ncbi:MAG: hypothetical protein AAF911_02500 [Planctomycetota bacterium]
MPYPGQDSDRLDPNRSFADYQRDPDVHHRYCKRCEYSLRGITSGECPECGLPFSLTNPRTYLTSDQLGQKGVTHRLPRHRAKYLLISLATAWLIPYALGAVVAFGMGQSSSSVTGELAGLGCCAYVILYPLAIMVATVCMLNALMPERMSGVSANILVGSLAAGFLMAGQLILITGPNPIIFFLGVFVGLPAGLWRAHQLT